MSKLLDIAAAQPSQMAEYEGPKSMPVQLWALCDDGNEFTSLAGLVIHPKTQRLVRADGLPGFRGYGNDHSNKTVTVYGDHLSGVRMTA